MMFIRVANPILSCMGTTGADSHNGCLECISPLKYIVGVECASELVPTRGSVHAGSTLPYN